MTEPPKTTITLGNIDLEGIDDLVERGVYSNRADFIRTSIDSQLDKHESNPPQAATQKNIVFGILIYDENTLMNYQKQGTMLDKNHPYGWYIEYIRSDNG